MIRSALFLSVVLFVSSAVAVPTSAPPVDELALSSGREAPPFQLTALADSENGPAPTEVKPSPMLQLGAALQDLLFTALLAGLAFLANFLRTKAAESKAARVGLVITESARAAVLELDATMKPKLKAYLADGVLSDEEKADLKKTAMELLKTKLPGGLLKTAAQVVGAGFLDTYLSGKVEEAVKEKKVLEAQAAVKTLDDAAKVMKGPPQS